MSEGIAITCPECGEVFSRREAFERDQHFLSEHGGYLRWECVLCSYKTSTRRKFDHQGHWQRRHSGQPQEPHPRIVGRVEEDRRQEEDRRKQQHPAPQGTRSSPRKRSTSGYKRCSTSPEEPRQPKRTSSRSSRRTSPRTDTSSTSRERTPSARREVTHSPAGRRAEAAQPSTSAEVLTTRRSPRKPRVPRHTIRPEAVETTETAAKSPARAEGESSAQDGATPEIQLHAPAEDFDQPTSPARDLSTRFEEALRFVRHDATEQQCRDIIQAAEERLPSTSQGPPPRQPAPGVQLPPGDSQTRTRLTWHPSGGLSLDSGTVHLVVAGPVEETTLAPQP